MAQHGVAGVVAVIVVERLEVVDVEGNDADRMLVPGRAQLCVFGDDRRGAAHLMS